MSDGFGSYILQMQQGTVPKNREFTCPLCGGIAHVQVGTRSTLPENQLWMVTWCEDCEEIEQSDGVPPWPGYESLLETDAQHYQLEENVQRIRRFARKGQNVPAIRLYRELYGADLKTAFHAVQKLANEA